MSWIREDQWWQSCGVTTTETRCSHGRDGYGQIGYGCWQCGHERPYDDFECSEPHDKEITVYHGDPMNPIRVTVDGNSFVGR